jgi:molybdopterin-guanine dinucleotide biosynthesis protein A
MISRCTGVVLAGGSSSRFNGARKGLLTLGKQRVVDWTLDALAPAVDELLLISNDPEVETALPSIRTRGDARRERGSLVGLHSALTYCTDAALVVGWDMPFLSSRFLLALRERGERASAAVIPESPGGLEPLCAYYPRTCLETAERQLAGGEMRLSAFVAALPKAVVMSLDDVRRLGAPDRLFANLNTPTDFAAARSMVDRGHLTSELATHRDSK